MLRAAEGYLRGRGIEAPRLSAEWLLAHVLETDRLQVYLAHDRPLGEEELAQLRQLVRRRGEGEPLAYLLGEWDFRGLTLAVNRDVLIPRPETEELLQLAVDLLPVGGTGVELGTGCGAMAIALASERPDLRILATDLSAAALEVARANADRAGVTKRVVFLEGSWWEPLARLEPDPGQLSFLLCNPPYVDPQQPELLDPAVARFEPATALYTTPGDPGSSYREIVRGMPRWLAPGARILLETGVGAEGAAVQILEAAAFLEDVELRQDAAGLPRYLLACLASP